MSGPAAIVVAGDEDLVAMQRRRDREGVGDLAECEVADDPDGVLCRNGLVPVLYEGVVHSIDVLERLVAVL